MLSLRKTLLAVALGACVAPPSMGQQAVTPTERESLEQLRQTTLALIELLVEQGVLSRERADALLRSARERAAAAAPPVVRVPYVPESVRAEIREELRQEIVTQARAERWAEPGALPTWLDRIQLEGDLRFRYQLDSFAQDNPRAAEFAAAADDYGVTRAPALAARDGSGLPTANTQEDRERLRVRARFGLLARLDPEWSGALRLASGTPGRGAASTNQTLGQNGTGYSVLLDRVFLRWEPSEWINATAGRAPQPFFASNLLFHDDLALDGLAVTARWARPGDFRPFVTGGYFLLRDSAPPARSQRAFYGLQLGLRARLAPSWSLVGAIGRYHLPGIEGRREDDFSELTSTAYGQYEYPAALRQQGNTLFRTNSLTDLSPNTLWGLASKFTVDNVAAAVDWGGLDPVRVIMSADYVRNSAFDRAEILSRTGIALTDGSNSGYQLRATVGIPTVRQNGEWQVFFGYRRLGSDAVLDGLNDSDFGLGGTNSKGYFVGGLYGIGAGAWLSLRYLASSSLDSPTIRILPSGDIARDRFRVDVLQFDLNLRF